MYVPPSTAAGMKKPIAESRPRGSPKETDPVEEDRAAGRGEDC